ncbi:hypothetical protein [Rhizobium sp.]|uniref:hypothetical protein n=1 Tax=Rhizobium sp. TaxID=391 RepID=UPI0034C5C331
MLDRDGHRPTHDKAFCFYKWQLEEIEGAKAALQDADQTVVWKGGVLRFNRL